MSSLLKKSRSNQPGFIFVGEHPAVDFGNTQSLSQRHWIEHLRVWPDVVDWLSLAGLSTEPGLQISTSRSAEVVKSVLRLRDAWRSELAKLVEGGRVSADFVRQLNQNLEPDVFYETLQRDRKEWLSGCPHGLSAQGAKAGSCHPVPPDSALPGPGKL